MKKKMFLFLILLISIFFSQKDVYAFSSNDYVNRNTCGNFEVASFKSDGSINTVSCHNTFEEAKAAMNQNGADDLAVLNRYQTTTRMLDANVALVDLTKLGSKTTFDIYPNSELTGDAFTYMVGSYGAVDGVLLDTAYSNAKNVFVAKIKIGNYVGWIRQNAYEIVPITWVKSSSSYTVTDEIRHNYVTKITDNYSGTDGRTIGPKPTMLEKGTYYSYDGHYFYKNLTTMIKDYKAGHYNNSVNKDKPYYNYYQYLSNHTRTNYSSINIDEYLRNNLGYVKDVFGNDNMNKVEHKSSKLYGKGAYFYYAQENYGANAALTLALARNESGNGTSNISINRNNGFGMNAVDSNPYEGSTWFPTFMSSIYEFAQYYVTYGYLDPNDWRYYGPQFGNKGIGMNVKYASDVYWSEKMAANYYFMDLSFGMQDYIYYQLGIITSPVYARANTNTSSKAVYYYRKEESGVVIIDEVEGQSVNGNNKWYKVVSDMNIDSNFNEITSGNYNWNSYVYVPAAYVKKINEGKNGYISPNEVTEYQDKGYTYDLFVENATFKPKVAKSVKETTYYYDPTLLSKKGQKLLKDRYVMVFGAAYDKNNNLVSYLVTSDYWYDQKHWVSADSIKLTSSRYGQASVNVPNTNAYTWINYNKVDAEYSKIGGLYTYAYIPIVGEEKDDAGTLWYKVPYDLSGTSYEFGYTLAAFTNVEIKTYEYKTKNTPPVITAKDKEIIQGKDYNELEGVTATDQEDGNLTSSIKVINNTVDKNIPGVYEITYKVTDKNNAEVTKTIKVTVIKDESPVINATDKVIRVGKEFNELEGISATDKEDGDITKNIKVIKNTTNINEIGTYEITYQVTDSYNNTATKTITIKVSEIELTKKNGEFYLNSLEWNKDKQKYIISGYLIILNENNNDKNAKYILQLKNKNTEEIYELPVKSWQDKVPYDLGKENGKDYSISWFKDEISLSAIPAGDYELYMRTEKNEFFAEEKVTNLFNKSIDRRSEDSTKGYNFKVQLSLASKQIELNVREGKLITTNTSNTFRNMINNYDDMKFTLNKLNIIGTSYNYGGTYDNKSNIKRTLILENTKTFKQYTYDIGSTNTGSYKVTSSDNLSKDYAWYNATIDVLSLPKATYSMNVYTKTKDSEDYGEINDIFGMINKAEMTVNSKTYRISLNKQRMNRIELIIE